MEKSVYRRMDKNLQRRHSMQRLLIFPDDKVPDDIMENITHEIRQLRPVPTRLDKIPEVEKSFPKVMDYPTEYVIR